MSGAIPPFPQYAVMAWCSVTHRDNCTLLPDNSWVASFKLRPFLPRQSLDARLCGPQNRSGSSSFSNSLADPPQWACHITPIITSKLHLWPDIRAASEWVESVQVKLSLCLAKHHAMNTYWGSGGIAPCIINICTIWRWIFSFTLWPLYHRRKSPSYPFNRWLGGP
jgi:hypothetical protein